MGDNNNFPPGFAPYTGEYDKAEYEVMVRCGRIYKRCWPNAGNFFILDSDIQAAIDGSDVVAIKRRAESDERNT